MRNFMTFIRSRQVLVLLGLFLVSAGRTEGQILVETLGGGPLTLEGPFAGDRDGNTLQNAQFNFPWGCAADPLGNLWVADRANGKLRRLDIRGNRTFTVLSGLAQPVDVALDRGGQVYVLNQGDGAIARVDAWGFVSVLPVVFSQPTALAIDAQTNLYVTELSGVIKRIDATNGAVTVVAGGLEQPRGLALLSSGFLAVSESDRHTVRIIDPANGATALLIGAGVAGYRDGPHGLAQFNQPHHLDQAPSGHLFVADHGNHCVRIINMQGHVATLYGIDPALWGPGYPGWFDGEVEVAESRLPVGLTIDTNGVIYTTEVYYHVVRQVRGSPWAAPLGGGSSGTSTNLVILPPLLAPDSGYYPMGQMITVTNPNHSAYLPSEIFYTTDGSEPTTNSARLLLSNNAGAIRWRETSRDLSSLRLKAFLGGQPGPTVGGLPATVNNAGFTRDMAGGMGATLVAPIVLNLRSNQTLRSLQLRAEITPLTPGAPELSEIEALPVTDAPGLDFVGPAAPGRTAQMLAYRYQNGLARGLSISYLGTNSQFYAERYAVAALIRIPIPKTARPGDRYRLEVLSLSGTSDAFAAAVPLQPLPPRILTITNLAYRVGDVSPGTWFQAGDFGDGILDNSDVNRAFQAALGVGVPPLYTDWFDAMDVWPADTEFACGGDGQIRFLDWQLILRRSLGLDSGAWLREWGVGGARRTLTRPSGLLPNLPAARLTGQSGEAPLWSRQALVGALPVGLAQPGQWVDLPVYLKVADGCRVAGFQFRLDLQPEAGAPALDPPPQFQPAPTMPPPQQSPVPGGGGLLCAWPMAADTASPSYLTGSNLLGWVRFAVPWQAEAGQRYMARFSFADGAPDWQTQYDFETLSAPVGIQVPVENSDGISDEWKLHFFGSLNHELARPDADPDGDGLSNRSEFEAGADPVQLRILPAKGGPGPGGFAVRWFARPGQQYRVERSGLSTPWTSISPVIEGQGGHAEYLDVPDAPVQFYRVRALPPNGG